MKFSIKQIDEKFFDNPENYIPIGSYCRGCVFLDTDTSKPFEMNGYCHYLKKGDWDFSIGLLWDGCKMCGVKNYNEWCPDCKHSSNFHGYTCECELLNKTIEDAQGSCEYFEIDDENH